MSTSPMSWIAQELGLTRLVETSAGVAISAPGMRASDAAQDDVPTSVQTLRLIGDVEDPRSSAALSALLQQARDGHAGSIQIQSRNGSLWRVLAGPLGEGLAEVLIVPAHTEAASEVQRRAALTDMAAAVSHEVSNALSAIGGWAELLQQHPGDAQQQAQALERIARCAKTAQAIARRLLAVVRDGSESAREDVDVTELVRDAADLLQLSARAEQVQLDVEIAASARVRGVRADLFSAVWNLTKNAIEACSAGDHVRLSVGMQGDDVQLRVNDTGPGMDAALLARIFTPYFSTKTTGTGLGLALVQRASEAAGGRLEVQSTPGQGTCFTVTLPRAGRHSDTYPQISMRVPRAADASQPLTGVRILVVDDDDALREMVATALEFKGAQVTACSGAQAAGRDGGTYDIALIDMMLSDGRGDELLATLRRQGVVEAAMLVTGVVHRPRLVPGGEPDDWVRKPFEIGPLVDRIRQTLERHRMLTAATAARPG